MTRVGPRARIVAAASLVLLFGCGADPGAEVDLVAPSGGAGKVVVAVGDIACPGEPCDAQRATADLVESSEPVVVLALGDLQYVDGSLDDFAASYEPTWGRFDERTRPVPGNHEYRTEGASGYFDYFGRTAHEDRGGYYSFDVGKWHLLAINSGTGTVSAEQLAWVRADLAADDHRCELAYWHHPRFSSGTVHGPDPEPQLAELWRILHDAGADVVLNGHEHNYERFAPLDADGRSDPADGIRQFVVGTGGRSLYPLGTPTRGSESQIAGAFGVLELMLRANDYGWRFIDVGGEALDEGSTGCHA